MQEDVLLKRYLSDNARYADLINGLGFGGRQVISAADLTELDSQTGFYSDDKSEQGSSADTVASHKKNKRAVRKESGIKNRDLIRKTAFGINFAVVGLENQKKVHYLMPLRVMSYDSGEYQRQAAKMRKKIKKEKGITDAEFLSGFKKDSRLHPCVTFVLFYGKEWDGSRDLHGILDFTDIPSEFKGLISNYKMNLIEIRKLENTDVFHTDLKLVFDFIRYSEDKKKLREMVENNPAYQEMEEDAYDVAAAFSGANQLLDMKQLYEKEERVNMCGALREMLKDEREEGQMEGRMEGRKEGIKVMVEVCKSLGVSWEMVLTTLIEKFTLEKEQAEQYMQLYW